MNNSFYIEDDLISTNETKYQSKPDTSIDKKIERISNFANGSFINTQGKNFSLAGKYSFIGFLVGVGYALYKGRSIWSTGILFGLGAGAIGMLVAKNKKEEAEE